MIERPTRNMSDLQFLAHLTCRSQAPMEVNLCHSHVLFRIVNQLSSLGNLASTTSSHRLDSMLDCAGVLVRARKVAAYEGLMFVLGGGGKGTFNR